MTDKLLAFDAEHIWHPYSAIGSGLPVFPVVSAQGVRLRLADGRELIDGMASWWCVIHGYNHPRLNQAITDQLGHMAHIMFGGLTHAPAVGLAERLIRLTPEPLQKVFFADSGSVSVEAALKMAIQYWHSRGQGQKQRFLSVRNGYHGDTFGAMSVCDPINGMHSLFNGVLPRQFFVPAPQRPFGQVCNEADLAPLAEILQRHGHEIAAVIIEPVVQGAGGMRFYSADYLVHLRRLCDRHQVLLIFDEIATGFGRTGRLFALEHAAVCPDILCLGKALTGGYLTLAAVLTSTEVSQVIGQGEPGLFMHGPTFMANPLACALANASIDLLLESPWQQRVACIEQGLQQGLAPCCQLAGVREVRVLGAIGVVELEQPVDMRRIQPALVEAGVWVRPFGRLVYLMPPLIMQETDLTFLTQAVCQVLEDYLNAEPGQGYRR
ncbi:adenosylmethionine--8-amino-7-oxononanoate transaminase [Magnetovirga frankeli]|uniref:adenosylmethionine--8-amino-7-oxononanoate transaminase n=1 Tax=Magnetovirga frankeli TaxID=947516 RepID=UPI001293B8B4|nr:adenosylmethionine--8-amino-7-oxononanoate transaminase [gamma proteobacterium SS-5]